MSKQWIPHPTILQGQLVDLIPLEKEHFEELYKAASDKELWKHIPSNCSERSTFDAAYTTALSERDKGNHYPFIIFHKQTQKIIGSTRFFEIYPEHRKLEIGWTWITREYWGTKVNFECKFLLLNFCFETLQTIRVQLKTSEANIRSQTAIQKIGAKPEGIFRKDKIQDNGLPRNTAYFSIIDDEWPQAKEKILSALS